MFSSDDTKSSVSRDVTPYSVSKIRGTWLQSLHLQGHLGHGICPYVDTYFALSWHPSARSVPPSPGLLFFSPDVCHNPSMRHLSRPPHFSAYHTQILPRVPKPASGIGTIALTFLLSPVGSLCFLSSLTERIYLAQD
jgi:hypothetical protein